MREPLPGADPRLCPWNDHGLVCGMPGSISEGLLGTGPWYCSRHFWLLKGRIPSPVQRRQTDDDVLRESVAFCAEHKLPTKVEQRAYIRETLPALGRSIVRDIAYWQRWAVETVANPKASGMARERALGFLAKHPAREPGQDDEEVAA